VERAIARMKPFIAVSSCNFDYWLYYV